MLNRPEFRGFHHLALTISEINRSRQFYTEVLGFQVVAEISPTWVVVGNNHMFFGLTQPTDPSRAVPNDRFNENRIGLDHLSFTVESRSVLEEWQRFFDERGVRHAEIKELSAFGIAVMMFWDPDNIQLEISAPL